MKKRQLPWINTARGIAIVLVILHHSIQWASSAGYTSEVWLHITWSLATMRLPLFFVIAGMLAVKWMRRPLRDVLTSKVATLAWLYLLWQLVTVLSYLVVPNVSTPGKPNLRELLTAAATPILPQNSLWFIWALALFFILGRVLYERLPTWAVLVPAVVVSSFSLAGLIHTGNLGWDGVLSNFVFFAGGVYGVNILKAFAAWLNFWTASAVVAGWVLCMAVLPTLDAVGLNVLTRALGLAAGISLGIMLQGSKRLGRVGGETLVYYLPHYVILGVLAFAASASGLPTSAAGWLPPAFFATTILLCVVLRRAVRLVHSEAWVYEQAPGGMISRFAPRHRSAKLAAHGDITD